MNGILALGLWGSRRGLWSGAVIVTAFVRGVGHAVSPGGRTWPVTFWRASRWAISGERR